MYIQAVWILRMVLLDFGHLIELQSQMKWTLSVLQTTFQDIFRNFLKVKNLKHTLFDLFICLSSLFFFVLVNVMEHSFTV